MRHVDAAKRQMGAETWSRWVSPRQELTLTVLFWRAKVSDMDIEKLCVDLSKCLDHGAFRDDGFMPPCLARIGVGESRSSFGVPAKKRPEVHHQLPDLRVQAEKIPAWV